MRKTKGDHLTLIKGEGSSSLPVAKPQSALKIALATYLCAGLLGALLCSLVWWVASLMLDPSLMALVPLWGVALYGAATGVTAAELARWIESNIQ